MRPRTRRAVSVLVDQIGFSTLSTIGASMSRHRDIAEDRIDVGFERRRPLRRVLGIFPAGLVVVDERGRRLLEGGGGGELGGLGQTVGLGSCERILIVIEQSPRGQNLGTGVGEATAAQSHAVGDTLVHVAEDPGAATLGGNPQIQPISDVMQTRRLQRRHAQCRHSLRHLRPQFVYKFVYKFGVACTGWPRTTIEEKGRFCGIYSGTLNGAR